MRKGFNVADLLVKMSSCPLVGADIKWKSKRVQQLNDVGYKTQTATHSSSIIRTPRRSNLDLQETADPKIDPVLFEWREHALSCKIFSLFFFFPSPSVPTAKQFILKTTKNNPAYISLIIVPADSPLLSSALFLVAPRIPHVCHFLSSSFFFLLLLLPSVWLCCSPGGRLASRHHLHSRKSHKGGSRARRRADRWMSRRGNESQCQDNKIFAQNKLHYLCGDICIRHCGNGTSGISWIKATVRCEL